MAKFFIILALAATTSAVLPGGISSSRTVISNSHHQRLGVGGLHHGIGGVEVLGGIGGVSHGVSSVSSIGHHGGIGHLGGVGVSHGISKLSSVNHVGAIGGVSHGISSVSSIGHHGGIGHLGGLYGLGHILPAKQVVTHSTQAYAIPAGYFGGLLTYPQVISNTVATKALKIPGIAVDTYRGYYGGYYPGTVGYGSSYRFFH